MFGACGGGAAQIEREIYAFKTYLTWIGAVEFLVMYVVVHVSLLALRHPAIALLSPCHDGAGVHALGPTAWFGLPTVHCKCRIAGTLLFFGQVESGVAAYIFIHLTHFVRCVACALGHMWRGFTMHG